MLTLVDVEHRVIKASLNLVILKHVVIIMKIKHTIEASECEHHWQPCSMVDQHFISIFLSVLLELIIVHITCDALVH